MSKQPHNVISSCKKICRSPENRKLSPVFLYTSCYNCCFVRPLTSLQEHKTRRQNKRQTALSVILRLWQHYSMFSLKNATSKRRMTDFSFFKITNFFFFFLIVGKHQRSEFCVIRDHCENSHLNHTCKSRHRVAA